ncbi:hypothetical protein BDB00DRAFT_777015, partial [Zychaea mexicana]|uniref:uncharacterized protein n=1 Tax=Zychaea mexicana TaxID=64656 RepID=UPI0022FF02AA
NDQVWINWFPDERDLNAIVNTKKKRLPPICVELITYLDTFVGKKTYHELMNHACSKFFDLENEAESEMDWAQSSIETALRLYPAQFFPLTDQTESDILKRVWIFIDKAFDNIPIDIRSGEMASNASSLRRNLGRAINNRKAQGHKTDLLMKSEHYEYGCCVAGKADHGDEGTKEKYEAGLIAPKMMEDMTWSLASNFADINKLVIAGLIISGLKIFALLLDRPSTYVCRLTKTEPMFFPASVNDFAVQMGSLIHFVWQIKQVMLATVNAQKPKTIQGASTVNSLLGVRPLPACATSPKLRPTKRQRANSTAASSFSSS